MSLACPEGQTSRHACSAPDARSGHIEYSSMGVTVTVIPICSVRRICAIAASRREASHGFSTSFTAVVCAGVLLVEGELLHDIAVAAIVRIPMHQARGEVEV